MLRCLHDLRSCSFLLFEAASLKERLASVDMHLQWVSRARAGKHIRVYIQLFEPLLFFGRLPSRMPIETQRVFFGALDAFAALLRLSSIYNNNNNQQSLNSSDAEHNRCTQ